MRSGGSSQSSAAITEPSYVVKPISATSPGWRWRSDLTERELAVVALLGRARVADVRVVRPDDQLRGLAAVAEVIGEHVERVGHVRVAQVPRCAPPARTSRGSTARRCARRGPAARRGTTRRPPANAPSARACAAAARRAARRPRSRTSGPMPRCACRPYCLGVAADVIEARVALPRARGGLVIVVVEICDSPRASRRAASTGRGRRSRRAGARRRARCGRAASR